MAETSGERADGLSMGISIKDNGAQWQSLGAIYGGYKQVYKQDMKGTIEKISWTIQVPQSIDVKCSVISGWSSS